MSAPQQKPQKQFPFVALAIGEGIGIVLGVVTAALTGWDMMACVTVGLIAGSAFGLGIGWLTGGFRPKPAADGDFPPR